MNSTQEDYTLLNDALCSVLFDGRFAGRPLYLDMESDLVCAAAEKAGVSQQMFAERAAECTREVLEGASSAYSLYGFALDARRWLRYSGTGYPSFTLLLSVLSMAAENMQADAQFSANNYYERLYALTGITGAASKARARSAFKATRHLWEAFNEWLRRHDGALGLPTAAAVIPSWTYVSYPISQALVRDADRQRLVRMFEHYSLNAGETVPPEEMEDYLEEWIPSPDSGTWLKQLWGKSDLRQKIAQTACLELVSWEGTGRYEDSGRARQNVTVLLQIGGWLKEELHILLGVAAGSVEGTGANGRTPAFSTAPSPFEGIDLLVPGGELLLSEVLAAGFEVETVTQGQSLIRRGRPIIPFAQSLAGPGYREASRTSLLGDYLILCHKAWETQTETHLKNFARPGWSKSSHAALPGLPEDWLLFRRVEFLQAPQANVPANLQCLVPLSESSLKIDGGLQLAGDDWHAIPGVQLHGTAAGGKLRISLHDPLRDTNHPVAESQRDALEPFLLAGNGTGLRSGNYEARLTSGGKVIRTLRFGLKDASRPRPEWSLSGIPEISYGSSDTSPLRVFGSTEVADAAGYVTGLIPAGSPAFCEVASHAATAEDELPPEGNGEPELSGRSESLAASHGIEASCAIRGHHVWECQPFRSGDDPREPKWQTCKGCQSTVILKRRGQIQRRGRRRSIHSQRTRPVKISTPTSSPAGPSVPAASSTSEIGANTLLDALFYLRGGRGARLANICSHAGHESWAGGEFVRNLIALGHIDASLSLPSGAIDYWRAAPPVLCETSPGHGFLAGFRSSSMLGAIIRAVEEVGASIQSGTQTLGPDSIFISAGSSAQLDAIVQLASQNGKIPFRTIQRPGARIAAMFPPAEAVLRALPEASPDASRRLERFNVRRSRWELCTAPGEPGAYRTAEFARRYYFTAENGRSVAAPFAMAKAFAARHEGIFLHGYREGAFIATLGCQPPGLLERALIACSGRLPQKDGGRIIYADVDKETASLVLDRLYGEGEPE